MQGVRRARQRAELALALTAGVVAACAPARVQPRPLLAMVSNQGERDMAGYVNDLVAELGAARGQRDACEKAAETERRSSAEALTKARGESRARGDLLAQEIAARGAKVGEQAAALGVAEQDAEKRRKEATKLKSDLETLRTILATRAKELEAAKNAGEEREAKAAVELSEAHSEIVALRNRLDAQEKDTADVRVRGEKEKAALSARVEELTVAAKDSGLVDRASGTTTAESSRDERIRPASLPSGTPEPPPRDLELSEELRQVSAELADALVTRDRLRAKGRKREGASRKEAAGSSGVIVWANVGQEESDRLNKEIADTENLILRLTGRLTTLQE